MGQLRVSGLSLKIEGAEGFQQALNASSAAMQRNNAEVKLLEATYGKSSTAMEYLSQRSDLLARRLEEQQKKTETLRQVREKYAAAEEADQAKLEKLDLEILKSQTAEAALTRQIKECSAEMDKQAREAADAADKQERLEQAGQDAAGAQKGLGEAVAGAGYEMNKAGDLADKYREKIERAGKGLESFGKQYSRFVTLPIMGMGTAAVKWNLDFEDAIYEVATLPGVISGTVEEQAKQLEDYADQLLAASDRSYTAAESVTSAMYDAISANIRPEDAVYWAERAAKAGIAGRTDAATVVSGASSVYNAWGEYASGGLDHILDVMMTAQNRGKTTVGALAGSVGQIAGLAPQLGVTMEEIFASVAAMTLGGTETSAAFTGLRGVLAAILKPTAQAAEKADELGLQFDATALRAKGLTGFLADVKDATDGDSEALGVLFGNVNGLNAVMQLGGSAAENYADILRDMQTAAGVLDQAFETRTSSRAMQLSGSMNQLKNKGIELAENLYPAVDAVTGLIGGASDIVGSMDADTQKALVNILGLTAAIGPATVGAGKLLKSFGAIKAAMASPWGWAALGAVGVGALVYQLATAETATKRMVQSAKSINLDISAESIAGMEATIQRGMALLEKEYYVKAHANWTIDGDTVQGELEKAFRGALEDFRLDLTEYSDILAILQGNIGGEITDAKQDPLTAALADELQAAVDEFNSLLLLIYRQGGTATEQEIADLETALERVKALRAELLGTMTEAEVAEADNYRQAYQHVVEGYGDERTLAMAMAAVATDYKMAIQGIDEAAKKSSIALQEKLNSAETDEEKQRAQESNRLETEQQEAKRREAQIAYAERMNELFAGWLGGSELGQQLTRLGLLLDVGSAIRADVAASRDPNLDPSEANAALRATLTPKAVAALGAEHLGLLTPTGELATDTTMLPQWGLFAASIDYQSAALMEEISAALAEADNPVAQAWQLWMQTGFNESDIDPSQVTGSLAGLLRLLLVQDQGLDALGSEAMEAIGAGIVDALPESLSEAEEAAGDIGAALRTIDSPYQAGFDAIDDIRKGMLAAKGAAILTGRSIADEISDSLRLITPGEGIIDPTFGRGDSGNWAAGYAGGASVNNSVNVTIQRANMNNPASLKTLASHIGAISRQNMAALGQVGE